MNDLRTTIEDNDSYAFGYRDGRSGKEFEPSADYSERELLRYSQGFTKGKLLYDTSKDAARLLSVINRAN